MIRTPRTVVAVLGAVLTLSLLTVAGPAGAVSTCPAGGISPKIPLGQSSLRIACIVDVNANQNLNTDHLEVHDAADAVWHRGAARTVNVTAFNNSTLINFLAGVLQPVDIRRPISGLNSPSGAGFGAGTVGGAFITDLGPMGCLLNCTTGHVSVASTQTTIHALVEHTYARVLQDAAYTVGGVLTSNTAKFILGDVGKSVQGGAFPFRARITHFTNPTTVTVTPAPANAHAAGDVITVGAVQYGPVPYPNFTVTYPDTWQRQITKTSGVTCAGAVLTSTPAGGGFRDDDYLLEVTFLNNGANVGTSRVTATTAVTATLNSPCPATWTNVVIGESGANAPKDGDVMASLQITTNTDPALVVNQDDCKLNTYEAFVMPGKWINPGAYGTTGVLGGTALTYTTAQVLFPTTLLSFAGYVIPKPVGDGQVTGSHYDFVMPVLPTTLATCLPVLGTTTAHTALNIGITANVLPTNPPLRLLFGNKASPPVRRIDPQTGAFGPKVTIWHGNGLLANLVPPVCVVPLPSVDPDYSCGTG